LKIHADFFQMVFTVETGMNDHILAEKIAIAKVLTNGMDW
jgi:hypothetical protein